MFKLFISLLLPLSLLLSACSSTNETAATNEESKTIIYTTVYPLQYFTERIGGEHVVAKTIYPPGSDEHTFEPSQKDMMALADSDLFIYIGLGLEGFVNSAKETLKNENVKMVATGENIEFAAHEAEHNHESTEADTEEHHEDDGHDHESLEAHTEVHQEDDGHNHGDIDPHVWLDPIYAKDLTESIKDALSEQMPEYKDEFEENYAALSQELDQLNEQFAETIDHAQHKEIIVSHAAYGYWEERYGLEQIGVSGLSTTSEPSQKDLEGIIAEAKKYDLNYVFFEQNVTSNLTEIIQKEVGAEALTLHNLSVLTDKDIQNNETYFTLMEANIAALDKSLNH